MGIFLHISLKEGIDSRKILDFLFNEALVGLFRPIKVAYSLTTDEIYKSKGQIGIDDKDEIRFDTPLLDNEKLAGNLDLTQLNATDCLNNILDMFPNKNIGERLDIWGSTKVFYKSESSIQEDWFFRERTYAFRSGKKEEYLLPILEVMYHFARVGITGHTFMIHSDSDVWLQKPRKGGEYVTADLNLEKWFESMNVFLNEFVDDLNYISLNVSNTPHVHEEKRIKDKFKNLPKFQD